MLVLTGLGAPYVFNHYGITTEEAGMVLFTLRETEP